MEYDTPIRAADIFVGVKIDHMTVLIVIVMDSMTLIKTSMDSFPMPMWE